MTLPTFHSRSIGCGRKQYANCWGSVSQAGAISRMALVILRRLEVGRSSFCSNSTKSTQRRGWHSALLFASRALRERSVRIGCCSLYIPKRSSILAFKYILAAAILMVVLGMATWFVYFVDEETDPPYGSNEMSDGSG